MEQQATKIERIKLTLFSLFGLCFFFTRSLRSFTKYELWYDHYTNIPSSPYRIGTDFTAVQNFCHSLLDVGNAYVELPSVYPPFFIFSNLIWTPLNSTFAYRIHASMIFFFLPLSLFMIAKLLSKHAEKLVSSWTKDTLILGMICLLAWNSYPLKFAMERGNSDLHALILGILGLYFTLKEEKNYWWSLIFFSMAGHFKVHPFIWYLIPLYRYGLKKTILPLLAINIAFTFCLGLENLNAFFKNLSHMMEAPYFWPGNHSVASFYFLQFEEKGRSLVWVKYLLYIVSVIPWLLFLLQEKWKTYSSEKTIFYFLLCLPLMCYLPGQSHDYKLCMMFVVHFAFTCFVLAGVEDKLKWSDILLLFLNFFFCMMQTRSYDMGPKGWNANKFLYLLGTEYMLYLWWTLKGKKRLLQ